MRLRLLLDRLSVGTGSSLRRAAGAPSLGSLDFGHRIRPTRVRSMPRAHAKWLMWGAALSAAGSLLITAIGNSGITNFAPTMSAPNATTDERADLSRGSSSPLSLDEPAEAWLTP